MLVHSSIKCKTHSIDSVTSSININWNVLKAREPACRKRGALVKFSVLFVKFYVLHPLMSLSNVFDDRINYVLTSERENNNDDNNEINKF